MAQKPEHAAGTRLCLVLTPDGLKAYGNRKAFAELAQWLTWLSESNEAEHYECHVTMSLEDDASQFEGKRPRNVWTLVDNEFSRIVPVRTDHSPGFELTFMTVENQDLDRMAQHQESGTLPVSWGETRE
jgi:hypothetical protein